MLQSDLISCLVVEDNPIERLYVEAQVKKYNFLSLAGSFRTPLEAAEWLRYRPVQLLLLDIDMPVLNGIDFLKSLAEPPLCVFITSHPEYALESFELNAFDYILKPLQPARFEKMIGRVKEYLDTQRKAQLYEVQFQNDFIAIKEGFEVVQIRLSEIVYLEAMQNYTKIVTPRHRYLTLHNLSGFLERLPEHRFIRIHRSYAVVRSKIKKLVENELIVEETSLPVGKTFRQEISRLLAS